MNREDEVAKQASNEVTTKRGTLWSEIQFAG
jgi:hypothetical protein